ncbi:MAG TPA: HAMP domain-containing protein [Polyangiaceae bacterium]
MKIRDSILGVLATGFVVISASLVTFVTREIEKIESITSDASSDVLILHANQQMEDVAVGIRDSLDSQMKNQYDMVRTWAKSPSLIEASRSAKGKNLETLIESWSRSNSRMFKDGEAVGDGDPDNDISPAASRYLCELSKTLSYPELFLTDARGYVVAASGITSDFDQGPDDFRLFEQQGIKKGKPETGGEPWYRNTIEAKDGMYVGPVKWDASANRWGIEIVSQVRDPADNSYLGQLKAVFDYGSFIAQVVSAGGRNMFELKIVDPQGVVVATSLPDKSKVNNKNIILTNTEFFRNMKAGNVSGFSTKTETDENGELVLSGFAVSHDVNRHVVVAVKSNATIRRPIDAFVGNLSSSIAKAGAQLRFHMLIVASVTAALAMLLAWLLLRTRITRPIALLTQVSEKLSRGEIEGLAIPVTGDDEIGRFGESFKGVLAAFNLMLEETEKHRK